MPTTPEIVLLRAEADRWREEARVWRDRCWAWAPAKMAAFLAAEAEEEAR